MFRTIATRAAGAAALSLILTLGGCASSKPMSDSSNANMSLWLSNSRIVVGDTTTLAVSSENTAGREPRFDWKSDGARIEQFENGRVAHVTYAQPGTYTVTATMTLRDGTRRSDSKTIAVDRVP